VTERIRAEEFVGENLGVSQDKSPCSKMRRPRNLRDDLGRDRRRDVEPACGGDIEGSGPLSYRVREVCPGSIHGCSKTRRTKDGYKRVHRGRSKGRMAVEKTRFGHISRNMMPVEELDEGIAIMLQKGKP